MANHLYPSDIIREAQRTARTMTVDDVDWLVYELPASTLDRRSTPSLVFESYQAVRRVRNYPANWRTLAAEALFALSWTV